MKRPTRVSHTGPRKMHAPVYPAGWDDSTSRARYVTAADEGRFTVGALLSRVEGNVRDEVLRDAVAVSLPAGATLRDIAAPVVDAELERERARLVGKRVRHPKTGTEFVVARVVRSESVPDAFVSYAADGIIGYLYCEPIPDEPAKPLTFAELEVGARFRWKTSLDNGAYGTKVSPTEWEKDGYMGRRLDATVGIQTVERV